MKITARAKVIFSIGILVFSSLLHAELLDELTPEQAYQQGTLLFQQNKYTQAKPLLKYAGENNHSAAAVMYAAMFFSNTYIQSPEEHEYVTKAAKLGNVFAMVAASNQRALRAGDYWRAKVTPILEQQAQKKDALAMRLLSMLIAFEDESTSFDWLIKAAEAGDPFSQHELARRYKMGDGWFIIPGKREKEIERLFKAAADSGYWQAMRTYAYRLDKQGDVKGYQTIIDYLVEKGDAGAILGLGSDYHKINNSELSAYYYGIYINSMGSEGHGNSYDSVKFLYDQMIENLTAEQIVEIEKKVQEYLKTHTVHYQKRIKDYEYTLDSIKQAKP